MPIPDLDFPDPGQDIARVDDAAHRAGKAAQQIAVGVAAGLQSQIGSAAQAAQQGDQSLYNQIQQLAQRVGLLEQQLGALQNVFPTSNPWALSPSNWGPPPGWVNANQGTITSSTGQPLILVYRTV